MVIMLDVLGPNGEMPSGGETSSQCDSVSPLPAETCEADTADAGGWVVPRSLFVSSAAFVRKPGVGMSQ